MQKRFLYSSPINKRIKSRFYSDFCLDNKSEESGKDTLVSATNTKV